MPNTVSEYAIPFAAWEVRLFLDTHPNDRRALSVYRQLCAQSLPGNYACVAEDDYSADCWHWIDDPWPWEVEANCPVVGRNGQPGCRANRCQMNSCSRRV